MIFFSKSDNQDIPGKNLLLPLALLALLTGIGVSFAIHALFVGHDHVFGTTREVPWGILITPYVFFACLSTGICIISSLGQVFGITTLAPLINRTVFLAIIAMAAGAAVMIAGYTTTAGILYGWKVAPVEFMTDIAQTGIGAAFALIMVPILEKRIINR
jgi:Ni/Fe-hydrogenase subunit HybB-like protein